VGGVELRSTERVNEQQGVNRVQRARKWTAAMRAAAEAYGYEPRVTCEEVPQMDHSFTKFCEHGALAQRVFAALFNASTPIAAATPPAPAPEANPEVLEGVSTPEGQACGHC
jgi:hypothetical protein